MKHMLDEYVEAKVVLRDATRKKPHAALKRELKLTRRAAAKKIRKRPQETADTEMTESFVAS